MAIFVTAKYEIKFSLFRDKAELNKQSIEEMEQQAEDFDDYLLAINFSGKLEALVKSVLAAGEWDKQVDAGVCERSFDVPKVFFMVERKG